MLFVKGIALGAVMFFVFSVIYFWALGWLPSGQIDTIVLKAMFGPKSLYWVACALMLALGCVIVAMWPVRVSP